jgi:cell division septum initiation protein DivIVA
MEYSPQEISTATFPIVKKGYDLDEVRSYLNGVSKALESSQQQATAMEARARAAVAKLQELTQAEQASPPAPAEPAVSAEESDAIGRTLLLAQRTADGLIAEARSEADTMVNAARAEASTMVADAQRQAETTIEDARVEGRRALETERAKAEGEVQALLARRDFLLGDVEQLEALVEAHRGRLLELSASLRETAEADLADLRRPLLSAAADTPAERRGGDAAAAADQAASTDGGEESTRARDDDDRPTEAISSLAALVDDRNAAGDAEERKDTEPTPIGNPSLLDFDA